MSVDGDAAFEQYVLPEVEVMLRVARSLTRNRADAEDLVQDSLIRAYKGHFTPEQHVCFEAAAWYWHFVEVDWLFLFAAVYNWGGSAFPAGLKKLIGARGNPRASSLR